MELAREKLLQFIQPQPKVPWQVVLKVTIILSVVLGQVFVPLSSVPREVVLTFICD